MPLNQGKYHPGCCAAYDMDGTFSTLEELKDIRHVSVLKPNKKELEFLKTNNLGSIVEFEGGVIAFVSRGQIIEIHNKQFREKHEELQKRDGREQNEFKKGDKVVFCSNPNRNSNFWVGGIYNATSCYVRQGKTFDKSVSYDTFRYDCLWRTE